MKYIGNEKHIERIEKFLRSPKDTHAFLFLGSSHLGKHTLATAFAESYAQGAQRLSFDKKRRGEVIEIMPEREEKKGIIKEKEISIVQIRAGIRAFFLRSGNGRKAMVIDEAHRMNIEAQNALLKTLEEPPANSIIILVAGASDTILPTILSRCEGMFFGRISRAVFESTYGDRESSLWEIALGLPGMAEILLRDEQEKKKRLDWLNHIQNIHHRSFSERIRLGEQMSKNMPDAMQALELFAFFFRERSFREIAEIEHDLDRAEKCLACIRLLKNTQVNSRLILENTMMSL